ncbi:hypothetical protein ACIQW7_12745 [Peribacillus simplex]|uniref:hypothetical protein n=1 Tax=Peribacillus simplex TaxID=1478 RepID=UPI003813FC48
MDDRDHFWPLPVQVDIFFKFIAAKVSVACIDNILRPLVVQSMPCFSFASGNFSTSSRRSEVLYHE